MSTKRHKPEVMVNLLRLIGAAIAKGKTTLRAALKVTSELATIQELSDFGLPNGVTQDLCWSAATVRKTDFSGRILIWDHNCPGGSDVLRSEPGGKVPSRLRLHHCG